MANIREFNAPKDIGLQPSDRAAESTASSGRAIAGLYSQAAEATASVGRSVKSAIQDVGDVAVKFMDHREISAGAPAMATALSDLDKKWNGIAKTADPNDPATAAKFREEVLEPQLEKLKGSFNTERSQAWADAQVDSMRNHFIQKTSSDMATLAGVAAKQNVATLTNQLSNAAITDPTSLTVSLNMVEHSIGAMVDSSPNLKGVDGARLKLELVQSAQADIVKAAAIGAIGKNPEAGLAKFSSPEYSKFLSGSELKQLEQQAKSVQRAERADQSHQRVLEKQAKTDASDAREGDYLSKLHSGDPQQAGQVSAKAIANDMTLTREARERMIGIVERETKPEAAAKISNATATDLISRIRAQAGDPTRIDSLDAVYDAYEKGKLSKSDLKFVSEEFKNLRTPDGQALGTQQEEFIKSVKPLLDKSNPLMGKIDQSGPQQVYQFTMDLKKKVDEYRRAGKDPRDLMDPSKPDYMGGPAALSRYQKPLQQSLKDAAASIKGGSGFPAANTITGITVESGPAATSVPKPAEPKPPAIGTQKDGYEYIGGSPGDARSWRKVGA